MVTNINKMSLRHTYLAIPQTRVWPAPVCLNAKLGFITLGNRQDEGTKLNRSPGL